MSELHNISVAERAATPISSDPWESFWALMRDDEGHLLWAGRDDFRDAAPWTAWHLENGKIPDGWSVVNGCGVDGCCHPMHLQLVGGN